MKESTPSDPQLEFPVDCCVKVIGNNDEGMHSRIVEALLSVNVNQPVVPGHTSAGGMYITHNIELQIQNQDEMQRIDAALRGVKGVKFVL